MGALNCNSGNILKSLLQKINSLQAYHPQINGLQERMNSSLIELQDIADELERIDATIHYDAQRIETVNERIATGYKLLKKHNVKETCQLLDIKNELQQKLDAVLNISAAIEKGEKQTTLLHNSCIGIAKKISVNRTASAKPFAEKVNKLLAQVGMPNAQIKVKIDIADPPPVVAE